MLSLKQYSPETASVILDPLLQLDAEFILTHSFSSIPREIALDVINKKRGKLVSSKDLGVSQIDALSELEDGIASDSTRLGYHHNSIMLLADSKTQLEEGIRDAVKAYSYSGMVLVKETLGAEPAFWAQIPGNQYLIARARLITSCNFVDFCSLHNYETGFRNSNHLSEAVTLLTLRSCFQQL